MEITLDIRKNTQENAALCYEQAKKAKRKVEGAKKALEDTLKKIEELQKQHIVEEQKTVQEKEKPAEKHWYEKFHYFFSSDSLLVIGGKDATSNEVIVKKYTEKNDLVFHADIQGAPFFIIKNESGAKIPESTIEETAQAAATYSKAWSLGLGNCSVYYISPEQVSKKAPSGEYIGKGAFMISGTKNWFRNVELKLAVGVSIDEEKLEVIGGPVNTVSRKCKYYVPIKPGYKKSKELAEDIKRIILKKSGKEDGQRIKKLSLEEFQKWIPSGKGEIAE